MDEENLDKELSERIREVFENFEDPDADEGWLALRKKYPEEEEDRAGFIWLWPGVAAALLLLFFSWWFFGRPAKDQQFAVKPQKAPKTEQAIVKNNDKNTAPVPTSAAPADTLPAAQRHQPAQPNVTIAAQTGKLSGTVHPNFVPANLVPVAPKSNNVAIAKAPGFTTPLNINTPDTTPGKALIAQTTTRPAINNNRNTPHDSVLAAAVKKSSDEEKATVNGDLLAMLRGEKSGKPLVTEKDKTNKKDKKAIFSVYAATYLNYAKGSDSQVNLGAGFSSDFSIGDNLKFSTGLAIAQNSLNYNSNSSVPVSAQNDARLFAASSSSAFGITASSPVSQNYNANLIGLDIPLNLKYVFNPKKSDTFISAGLSSGTFINETYHSTFTYGGYSPLAGSVNGSTLSNVQAAQQTQTQEQTTRKSFNSFDFAKTLNLSFGMGYPLGKNNRLVIEPFLKYPLDGLGAEQIKFGAGGVNLKLNFQTRKK